jgi:hypothetical protein
VVSAALGRTTVGGAGSVDAESVFGGRLDDERGRYYHRIFTARATIRIPTATEIISSAIIGPVTFDREHDGAHAHIVTCAGRWTSAYRCAELECLAERSSSRASVSCLANHGQGGHSAASWGEQVHKRYMEGTPEVDGRCVDAAKPVECPNVRTGLGDCGRPSAGWPARAGLLLGRARPVPLPAGLGFLSGPARACPWLSVGSAP